MPHELDDLPQQVVALREVRLGKHAVLATAVTGDPQQPRRESRERLVHRLDVGKAVGHPHGCASSVRDLRPAIARGPAHEFSKQRFGGIAAPLVLLGVDVLRRAEARRGLA